MARRPNGFVAAWVPMTSAASEAVSWRRVTRPHSKSVIILSMIRCMVPPAIRNYIPRRIESGYVSRPHEKFLLEPSRKFLSEREKLGGGTNRNEPKGTRPAARLRGGRSNRQLPDRLRKRVTRLIRREYSDFGPTLIAEYLAQEHGLTVGKETVRKWMIGDGLWKPKRARVGQVHTWRARRASPGELVQWDTSVHAWLEDRGPAKMYLVALIDDATNTLFARFVEADTTEQNMRVLWGYLERYG